MTMRPPRSSHHVPPRLDDPARLDVASHLAPAPALSPASPLSSAVERHYEELKAFLVRRLGSVSAADDIIQDLWLRLARDRPAAGSASLDGEDRHEGADERIRNPRAYLYRVAANLATDRLRQERRRHAVISGEPVPEQVQDHQPLADQVVSGRQEFALLQETIRELPEKCREAFLLYRGENLTMQQVANRLGISSKTVEKHIAKAMLACRNQLRALREPG